MGVRPEQMFHEDNKKSTDKSPAGASADGKGGEMTDVERRRHWRVHINLLGRFMRQNKQEYPCKILNMSPGGVAMLTPDEGEIGEHIVAYIDHIGRVEGTVTRTFEGGFAIQLEATPYKREKIASQLTWLANKNLLDLSEGRRHERIVPRKAQTVLQFENGQTVPCKLLDVSLSGASIEMEDKPPIGMQVMLGKMRGRVVRHHVNGIGIEFLDIQNPKALSNYFG